MASATVPTTHEKGALHHLVFSFLGGAFFSASIAFSWFHWARNSWPSPPPARVEVQASCVPSGEDTGQAVEPVGVGDAHRLLPAGRVDDEQLEVLESELVRREDEVLTGRMLVGRPAHRSEVGDLPACPCRPGFIVQMSAIRPDSSKRRQTMR